jgi:hypothetical protein
VRAGPAPLGADSALSWPQERFLCVRKSRSRAIGQTERLYAFARDALRSAAPILEGTTAPDFCSIADRRSAQRNPIDNRSQDMTGIHHHARCYFPPRGVYENFWPDTDASYIRPPLAMVNTTIPS